MTETLKPFISQNKEIRDTPFFIMRPMICYMRAAVAVLGGGAWGHGPGPRAFHAQKGPRTFTPPPHAFVRMSKSIR